MPYLHPISDEDFKKFARLLYEHAGIYLSDRKKLMLETRLRRRLNHHQLEHFGQYYRLVTSEEHRDELQIMVDHLTTNETHFFREAEHFQFLSQVLKQQTQDCRVWCAASSSGEEVYTLAMVLDEALGDGHWSVLGSDISQRMLQQAKRAIYPETSNTSIPQHYLKRYCLKGVGPQNGRFTVERRLKQAVDFRHLNLTQPLPVDLGEFDFIFIRNVMIYFDAPTKQRVVNQALTHLKLGGYIFTSHAETLHGLSNRLTMIRPSIYRKIAGRVSE